MQKIKTFFIRIWNWIKNLLRKTNFDNELFKQGVEEVRKDLKEELAKVASMSVDKFYDTLIEVVYDHFGHVKIVRTHLDTIVKFAHDKTKDLKTFADGSINKKIDMLCDKMISWYNENF